MAGTSEPAAARGETDRVWQRIREHRIIQSALGYLAAALALTHVEDLIARAYGWPDSVGQILIAVLGLGLPVAVTLAWYHGHRASRHVSGAEASIIAILLLLGAGLLWALVRPHQIALSGQAEQSLSAQNPPVQPALPASSAAPAATAVPSAPSSSPLATGAAAATAAAAAPAPGKSRLAILPFENLSPDPKNAFFTDGLHEEILTALANRSPDLEVISRTTMMVYRGANKTVQEIARELGATHVLEGSVRREGNEVRLTLQLIDARSDEHLWAQDYDRTLVNALTLQSEVANKVASQLSAQLTGRASTLEPLTHDPEAYDLYLKMQLERTSSITGISTPVAVLDDLEGFLNGAVARDPSFAVAYADRSGIRNARFFYNYDTDGKILPLAQQDLATAERLAPGNPNVLFQKGLYLVYIERDLSGGLAAYEAADAAGLSDPGALSITSEALEMAGRLDEAVDRSQRALALDPKNPFALGELIGALLDAGRPFAQVLRSVNAYIAEFPARVPLGLIDGPVFDYTGNAQALSRVAARIIAASRVPINASDNATSLSYELSILRVSHHYRESADLLDRATTPTIRSYFGGSGEYPVAELRGWTHLLLGDRDAAARDGREVLEFVAHRRETKWNRALLHLLVAEGNTFVGDRARAVAASRETLSLAQWPNDRRFVSPIVACVYAWAGAKDEAAALLEQLSTQLPPVMTPAEMARDPLYGVPLAGNARFEALRARLEAQMAATKLE